MLYSNKKYLSHLKTSLMVAGLMLLVSMSATIYFQNFELLIVLSVLLIALLVLNRVLNFCFVKVQLAGSKMTIRYYSLFATDRNYELIEFPVSSLRKVTVKKYLFGLKWDLYLTVRLKQGMAGYPAICLSAVPFSERRNLVNALKNLAQPS